jgi:hypothetical protein
MAFFLLSGPELGPNPGVGAPQAASARESQAPLECVYGISRDPGCCNFAAVLSARLFELCL